MVIKKKNGQIKIQQMAFMLIAVTLFFVIAGMFFLVIRFSSLKSSAALLNQENAMLLVSKIADSPEFSCGSAFGEPRTNCIDTDKLMAIKDRIDTYNRFWGINGLEIQWVYPNATDTECTLENYPDCGKLTLIASNSGTGVANFVSLCRKESEYNNSYVYDKCDLGRVVAVYGS